MYHESLLRNNSLALILKFTGYTLGVLSNKFTTLTLTSFLTTAMQADQTFVLSYKNPLNFKHQLNRQQTHTLET